MHIDTPTSLCRFGLARCDITPPVGIYHRMWGAATHDRASGVHQPLGATAMAFHPARAELDAAKIHVVVAVDHCLLWAKEMDALLHHVASATGLGPEQLTIAFSHTHAAGLMDTARQDLPGGDLIAPYLEEVARRLASIVNRARAGLTPVTITYGTGRCSLAAQRDFWDESSRQYVCGFNPHAPADDTVLVARVTCAKSAMLAVIVNYACHPTTLAWENTLISPDYPGAMREVVEQGTGASCVFLQGASGDLGPREGFVGDSEVAERNGRQLGHAVLATLEALPPPATRFVFEGPVISGATLGAWQHQPLDDPGRAAKESWQIRRWTVPLAYRSGLSSRDETEHDLRQWLAKETEARAARDDAAFRDAHAMVERMTRRLTRIRHLPQGSHFPMPATLWRMGDALWLAVEGEFYQAFQKELRARFPAHALMIVTLANGSRCSYLPTAETYDKGIYQESIAVLAPGCLERMVEAVSERMAEMAG